MPLSRHFYSLEEVQAAVLYTGSRGIPHETVFWCQELIESGCVAEAIAALFESWLWNRAPFGMDWLVDAQQCLGSSEVTAEDILCMADRLSRLPKKDHSLWWLFVREEDAVDRVTPRTPLGLEEWATDAREQFFVRALYQGKTRSAWWAGEGLPHERWWEIIHEYIQRYRKGARSNEVLAALRAYEGLLGYTSETYDRAIRGVILLWLSLCEETERVHRPAPAPLSALPLSALPLPAPGRSLTIPSYGLYGITRRGQMSQKENTMGELWDVFASRKGCPYWDEWAEQEKKEGEEDMHFPMDLPDEWTREEKEKSHGAGLLREGEVPNLWGYTKRYMMGLCRGVWMAGPMAPIQERLEKVAIPKGGNPFLILLSLSSPSPGPLGGLAPIHKKCVVRP